jgi:hypothetical protein
MFKTIKNPLEGLTGQCASMELTRGTFVDLAGGPFVASLVVVVKTHDGQRRGVGE